MLGLGAGGGSAGALSAALAAATAALAEPGRMIMVFSKK
jgi:hypothetical protein